MAPITKNITNGIFLTLLLQVCKLSSLLFVDAKLVCTKNEDCQIFKPGSGIKMLYPPECDVETKRCVNTFSKYGCLRSEGFDVIL